MINVLFLKLKSFRIQLSIVISRRIFSCFSKQMRDCEACSQKFIKNLFYHEYNHSHLKYCNTETMLVVLCLTQRLRYRNNVNLLDNTWLPSSEIKLIRTDTTLDLSQRPRRYEFLIENFSLLCILAKKNSYGENIKLASIKIKNIQHLRFPCGPPPQYQVGPTLLDFRVRMGSGISKVV